MIDLKAHATKAFIWDFVGRFAMHGTGFIVTIFLARLLEPADFGLVAIVAVIIGVAQVFTDIGLGGALIQRRRVLPIHYSSVFYFNIFIAVILTFFTFFSATWIGDFYKNMQLIAITQVMSFAFVINAFSSVQTTRLRKELNYAALTKVRFMSSFLSGVIGVAMALNGAGVWSLIVQILSLGVIYNILIWKVAFWRPSLVFSFKALLQLWGFGFRMFLAGLLDAVFTRLDFLIIGKLFSPATLGFYQRAKSLDQMIITYSSGSLMSVLFPVLSKVQNDLKRFQNIIVKALGIISFVVFFLLGSMYLVAEELIVILFSSKWLPSVEYFKLLALSGFAYPISALLVNVLKSRGDSKAFLRLEIYKKVVYGSALIVAFAWGIEGYLYGLILASSVAVWLNIHFASREISLSAKRFIVPILIQMSIAIVATMAVLWTNHSVDLSDISMLLIKSIEYAILYFLISKIFFTAPYQDFAEQAAPVLNRLFKREKNE